MNNNKTPIFHSLLSTQSLTAAIVPVGIYLNRAVEHLQRGREIAFVDKERREVKFKYRRKLKIGSSEFCLWLALVYGERYTFKHLEKEWREYCMIMGFGERGYSTTECWLVICESDEK